MSYLQNDQSLLRDTANMAFNRRKQLCPFPLEPEDLIDVMHSPDVAKTIRWLRNARPKALNWERQATLILPTMDPEMELLRVTLKMANNIPMAVAHGAPPETYTANGAAEVDCYHGPTTIRLLDWAWKAAQIELENRWSMRIVRRLVNKTTTHQQVHRYMPELYNLLAQQEDLTIPKSGYGYRRRICDVAKDLKEIGSKRASKVELQDVSVRDRSNLKTLVVGTLLLPAHNGLGPKSIFDDTWIDLPRTLTFETDQL